MRGADQLERIIISTLWNRATRNAINDDFKYLFNGVESMKKTIDDLILEAGNSDPEVIQARGGEELLNDRLTKIDGEIGGVKTDLYEGLDEVRKELDEKAEIVISEVEPENSPIWFEVVE